MKSKSGKNGRMMLMAACGVLIIGLGCMIAGIVLMVKYSTTYTNDTTNEQEVYTSEARNSGLNRLFDKLQNTHYELYPNRIFNKPGVSESEVRMKYNSMDLSPERIRYITDKCQELLEEFKELQTRVTRKNLSLREKRALEIAMFWTKHSMPYGVPYGYDYHVGDWMLSPDVFCWMPICSFAETFEQTILKLKPYNTNDMEYLREKLIGVNKTFAQYIRNIQMGVEAGMVRNIDGCKAGYDGIKEKFLSIALHGKQGILKSTGNFLPSGFFDTFLSELEGRTEELESWRKRYGKSMNDSLKEFFLDFVGEPIHELLRFLEEEHMQYCPPGDIIKGYHDLPASFVYKNGTAIRPTTKRLPTGEPIIGVNSYRKILNYFTSTDMSAESINELGYQLIEEYYQQILEISRHVTKETDNKNATDKLKEILTQEDMYFNDTAIPESESNEKAYELCSSEEGARKHCPVRWRAVQNWFTYSRQIIAELDAQIINLFHFSGPKHTTPNCPVDLKPDFNPSTAAQGYKNADPRCLSAAGYYIPFFLKRPGPKYEEWTVCAHETRPGHHLQAQGYLERFSAADEGIIKWLSVMTHFLGFQEGWAVYSESPLIAIDVDAYKNRPLLKYGNLKWQVMQAIRLVADTSFHSIGNLTRQQARELKYKYLWDNSDIPDKEITRYQSLPGQAVTYLVGKIQILKLRQKAERLLGDKFNIKDFHFQLLHYGPTPYKFLKEMIDLYISCVLDSTLDGCKELLTPLKQNYDKTSGSKAYYSRL